MSARTTMRRFTSPLRRKGPPNAGMDPLAMTVLSRSKKAAFTSQSYDRPPDVARQAARSRSFSRRDASLAGVSPVAWSPVSPVSPVDESGSGADEQGVDCLLDVAGHEHEHLVARLEDGVAARYDEAVPADDRDDGRVSGNPEIGDRDTGRGRPLGERHLDEMCGATLELEQAHERPHRDRFLHEGGEELGRRDGDVDS